MLLSHSADFTRKWRRSMVSFYCSRRAAASSSWAGPRLPPAPKMAALPLTLAQMENSFSLAQTGRAEIKSPPNHTKNSTELSFKCFFSLLPELTSEKCVVRLPARVPCPRELSVLECWRASRGSLALELTHVRCSARIFLVEKWPQL